MREKFLPGLCHYATRSMLEQTFAPVPPTPSELEWNAYWEERHAILGSDEPWDVKIAKVHELKSPASKIRLELKEVNPPIVTAC